MSHQALIAKGNENKIHSFLYNTRKQYSQGEKQDQIGETGILSGRYVQRLQDYAAGPHYWWVPIRGRACPLRV